MIVRAAREAAIVVPSFNVPHLPMVEPIVKAVSDEESFAFIAVARIEWMKLQSKSLEAVAGEYARHRDAGHVRLHLDHVPVIDEDNQTVDYRRIIERALGAGYDSVMVDGSRLSFAQNVAATRSIVELCHRTRIPVEAELGSVFGHEAGPQLPYDEIFRLKKGFTDVEETRAFVRESGCDWLSVAFGSIHGAVSEALRNQPKVPARLDLDHLRLLAEAARIPLVLHGGSAIPKEYIRGAIGLGVAKVNVGAEIRQAYESALKQSGSVPPAQDRVYDAVRRIIRDVFEVSGSAKKLTGRPPSP
jgi:fructose-bisphosphate aldolase class II